jgi:hypothetical protein
VWKLRIGNEAFKVFIMTFSFKSFLTKIFLLLFFSFSLSDRDTIKHQVESDTDAQEIFWEARLDDQKSSILMHSHKA